MPESGMDWQPIETAPKDGTEVILFYPGMKVQFRIGGWLVSETIHNGKTISKHEQWTSDSFFSSKESAYCPTHWMPLPESPK